MDKIKVKAFTYVMIIMAFTTGVFWVDTEVIASSERVIITDKIQEPISPKPNYEWNWVTRDKNFLYQMDGKLHIVTARETILKDYTFNKKYEFIGCKAIILPNYDKWGGFYHSKTGDNYVAIGYKNKKQSKTKTVIKVIKYSKSWKKQKMANIKGGVKNAFEGIYVPFDAGNVSFAENEGELYLFTSRSMFKHADGLHHQSNIGFTIDTSTMAVSVSNPSYCSHSFNQIARFKDGKLFLLDHGDAYPRAIKLTTSDEYEGASSKEGDSDDLRTIPGNTGENYTGIEITGMEISDTHVIVSGIENMGDIDDEINTLFLVSRKISGGDSKARYIDMLKNARQGKDVKTSRMVKVSNDKYAVLYKIYGHGKKESHCMIVDGTGKKIHDRIMTGAEFENGCQPIMYNGKIVYVYSASNGTKINIVSPN